MKTNKLSTEVLFSNEFMCLRILQRLKEQPIRVDYVNLSSERYTIAFTSSMCHLIQCGLITINEQDQVAITDDGRLILESVNEALTES